MQSYNNESDLEFDDYSQPPRNTSASQRNNQQQPVYNDNTRQSRQPVNNDEPDAVYLMNGRVIKGVIEDFDPDDFVSIRTSSGRVVEYSMDEVKRVSQTSLNNNRRPSAPAKKTNTSSPRSNTRDDRYNNNSRSSSFQDDYDYSESGYKGIFDVGFNVAIGKTGEKSNFEFNTSHGYQINEYLFAGAGLGLHIYSARDSAMKRQTNYPHYTSTYRTDSTAYLHAVDSSYMTLPIFLDIRGYLPLQNSKLAPFIMFRFGYSFNLSDGFSGMGIYMNPAVGLKYKFSPNFGANFSLGYAYQSYGGIPKAGGYGYYYIKDSSNQKYEAKGAGGFSLKLGIEF
jgi:sRNA-binding regulator protein Hfq